MDPTTTTAVGGGFAGVVYAISRIPPHILAHAPHVIQHAWGPLIGFGLGLAAASWIGHGSFVGGIVVAALTLLGLYVQEQAK